MSKKEISVKNTKNDILNAYEEALEEIKNLKAENTKVSQQRTSRQGTLFEASSQTPDKLITSISSVKINVAKSLDELSEKLLSEEKKLTMLQKAIVIEEQSLKDHYQIKTELDTLDALVAAHYKIKSELDLSISTQRDSWFKEKEQMTQSIKEDQEATAKSRQSEQEEYDYQLAQTRKREEDAYCLKQQALEQQLVDMKVKADKDIFEREKLLSEAESELASLRDASRSFSSKLEQAVNDAVERTKAELEQTYQYQAKLNQVETSGKIALHDQTNKSLLEKIKEQQSLIDQLSEKSSFASDQVQSIAIKAIEGAARGGHFAEYEKSKAEKAEV